MTIPRLFYDYWWPFDQLLYFPLLSMTFTTLPDCPMTTTFFHFSMTDPWLSTCIPFHLISNRYCRIGNAELTALTLEHQAKAELQCNGEVPQPKTNPKMESDCREYAGETSTAPTAAKWSGATVAIMEYHFLLHVTRLPLSEHSGRPLCALLLPWKPGHCVQAWWRFTQRGMGQAWLRAAVRHVLTNLRGKTTKQN
jgi:hypothetical protein